MKNPRSNKFWALLKKDWRLNRAPLTGLAIAGTLPYLFYIAYYFHERDFAALLAGSFSIPMLHHNEVFNLGPSIYRCMGDAAYVVSIFTVAIAAVLGGAAFAQERRDRSAEFLAMLPAPRWKIIGSKFLVAGGCLLIAVLVHGSIKMLCEKYAPDSMFITETSLEVAVFAGGCLAMFGVAWAFSTFLTSPAIAASLSIAMLCAVSGSIAVFIPRSGGQEYITLAFTIAIGLCGLSCGSIYYKNRIAP